jgi:hypothetical protein
MASSPAPRIGVSVNAQNPVKPAISAQQLSKPTAAWDACLLKNPRHLSVQIFDEPPMKSEVKRREHATRDSDLGRSASALAIGRGRRFPSGPVTIGCYALTKMNFKCSKTNVSSENNLCRLQRGGFSQIAIVPLRRSRSVSETI